MSLKQIAVSAALMGNGVAAVKLSLASGQKLKCADYIQTRVDRWNPLANHKKAARAQELQERKRQMAESGDRKRKAANIKLQNPQLTERERHELTADALNSAKRYADMCHQAGGTPKAKNEIPSQKTAYQDEMSFRAQEFLNLDVLHIEDLPKAKRGETPIFGQQDFDYMAYFNKYLHKEVQYTALDDVDNKSPKQWEQVDASFVAHCCSVPPVDDRTKEKVKEDSQLTAVLEDIKGYRIIASFPSRLLLELLPESHG
ncbi:unnamed protein product [Amoebophrya sp. A25]|nr:unnamed protein product [Amoebophrya sp. A25]|eukprot:GSA25T00022900001.1